MSVCVCVCEVLRLWLLYPSWVWCVVPIGGSQRPSFLGGVWIWFMETLIRAVLFSQGTEAQLVTSRVCWAWGPTRPRAEWVWEHWFGMEPRPEDAVQGVLPGTR